MSERKIKVLLIAYACEPNKGSEPGVGWNWAINLSKYVNITVLTRKNNKKSIDEYLAINNCNNLDFIYYDLPKIFVRLKKIIGIWSYYFLWQLGALIHLKKKFFVNNFNIVHHVTFMSNKFSIAPLLGIKNIIGPVGGLEIFPLHLLFFSGRPLKEFLRNLLILRYKYSILYNYYLKKIDILILTSYHNRLRIKNKYWNKVKFLQIGSNDFSPEYKFIFKQKDELIKIYWGGILERWKGLGFLLYALKNVLKDNKNIRLIITGKGRDELYFKKLITKLALHDYISFNGWVTPSKLIEIKKNTDIFVFTSLRETTGSILLEMMGLGKPCIVFNYGGPSEICNISNALLIDVNQNKNKIIESLTNALQQLISDENLRYRLGVAAYNTIYQNYTWDVQTKRMIKIYKELLNENSANS